MGSRLAVLCGVLSLATLARAGEGPEVGGDAGSFMLKAINTEALGGQSAQVRLDDFIGADAKTPKKAVLLAFFASWCEPCKREMPYLSLLYDTYQDKGLQVLSITIDKEADKIEVAHNLARQNGLKYPVLSDHYNILARRYAIDHLPAVYLINAQGHFAWINVGYGENASKQLLEEVRKALGIAPSEAVPETISTYLSSHQGPAHAESVVVPGAEKKPEQGAQGSAAPGNVPAAGATPGSTPASPSPPPAATATADDEAPPVKSKGKKKGKARGRIKKKALADD